MTSQEIVTAVDDAIATVNHEEPLLDFASVHERSTAHRLAVHMERAFAGWNIDCEYDRDGRVRKELLGIADCDEERTTDRILPDIIVHRRRGEGRAHNLLVIELKKNAGADPCDWEKLTRLTAPGGHYQYQFGLYINIDHGRFTKTWFLDGKPTELNDVLHR